MAIPNNSWSSEPVPSGLLPPHDNPPVSELEAYDNGPIAIGDVTQGLSAKIWGAVYDPETGNVLLDNEIIFNQAGIEKISLTFDQQGRPFFAFCIGNDTFIRWFDPIAQEIVVTQIAQGNQALCNLDERRKQFIGDSDVLLFYVRDDSIFYRVQRDRFMTEYATPVVNELSIALRAVSKNRNGRLEIDYVVPA